MNPRYKPIDPGFHTADGEGLVIHYGDGELRCQFTDIRSFPVEFIAAGVLHFAWSEELFEPDIRDDLPYEMLDSPLVARLRQCNGVPAEATLRHFKLCFNARGVLDIVFEQIRIA